MNTIFDTLARVAASLFGILLVAVIIFSVVRTFILPRSSRDPLSSLVFIALRKLFEFRLKFLHSYRERDATMALYAPFALLSILPVWYFIAWIGFAFIFWAIGADGWYTALKQSGSSLFTLGFQSIANLPVLAISGLETVLGLIMVALLISYLPTMYSAFSRRETAVTLLEVRAGDPPSAIEMLLRYYRIHGLQELGTVWHNWETWFADIEESHTSLAALVHFRSPLPNHSWLVAAGTVLDTAALTNAAVDIPHDARADLCIRSGYLALRHIADFFEVKYDPHPRPDDPISISRGEFEEALDELASNGLSLKPDRDQAWKDFAGWRVNYDTVLLALAKITMAPPARWISDR